MISDYNLIYYIYPTNIDLTYSYSAGNSVIKLKIEVAT